jgi:threonine/homoserine/homoserine lactone efflux protein
MKLLVALVVLAACAASAVSRLARIPRHRAKGGPLMRRRVNASLGLALGSLGWAAAVLPIAGIISRSPVVDWALLLAAAAISVFMAWTLVRADSIEKVGGDVQRRQAEAQEELERIRNEVRSAPTRSPR